MPVSPSSSAQQARQTLANRLREIRLAAGVTARALATVAGWHESKCSRIEHAKTIPSDSDIRFWCDVCDAPDQVADLLTTAHDVDSMYVEWRRVTRSGLRRVQETAVPLYQRTERFRIYEPGVLPELFQTRGYALARMKRIAAFSDIPDDIEAAVDARIARQQVVRAGGHMFTVLIEEWALYARLGDTEMMATQLGHLIGAATLPNVALGIIPMNIDRTMWPLPGFWIFDDTQVEIELPSAKVTVTQPRELAVYTKAFAELSKLAVRGARARTLITTAIDALA